MFNWLSLVTGVFYIVLGGFVIARNWFLVQLEPQISIALGVLMIAYGVFRIGRAIYRLKKLNDEN